MFLLKLLTDKKQYRSIRWVNNMGEFVLLNKDKVSKLWDKTKNNDMNYETLSCALRHYYEPKCKVYKNFSIMQKEEESSIKVQLQVYVYNTKTLHGVLT